MVSGGGGGGGGGNGGGCEWVLRVWSTGFGEVRKA